MHGSLFTSRHPKEACLGGLDCEWSSKENRCKGIVFQCLYVQYIEQEQVITCICIVVPLVRLALGFLSNRLNSIHRTQFVIYKLSMYEVIVIFGVLFFYFSPHTCYMCNFSGFVPEFFIEIRRGFRNSCLGGGRRRQNCFHWIGSRSLLMNILSSFSLSLSFSLSFL